MHPGGIVDQAGSAGGIVELADPDLVVEPGRFLRIIMDDGTFNLDIGHSIQPDALTAVAIDFDPGDRQVAGQFHEDALAGIVVKSAAIHDNAARRRNVLAAALDRQPRRAIVTRHVVQQQQAIGAGGDVEAMPVVGIGDVVLVGAVDQEIGDEPVQAVAMRHAVGDPQIQRLLVRVEAVPAAVHDLHAFDRDVVILAEIAWRHASVETVDLAGGVGPVAVDGQVIEPDIVGDGIVGRAHHAGDRIGAAIRHLEDGLADAGAL